MTGEFIALFNFSTNSCHTRKTFCENHTQDCIYRESKLHREENEMQRAKCDFLDKHQLIINGQPNCLNFQTGS